VLGRSGTSWYVRQRIMSGGLDRPLVTRLVPSAGAAARNMAFIADRQGTTLAAVNPSGLRDETAAYFGRNVFGQLEGASGTGSSSNPETGFTGASTPNQTGGFTYLRNRWYDPQSGRFLTQDPIGLAGGVNLYAYAGNNPVAYTDPFGLDPCSLHDRSKCEFLKVSGSIGVLPAGVRFKVGSATVKGSAGLTGAASGSVSLGSSGLTTSGKLSLGASVDGAASAGGAGISGSYGCSATTNNSGGCKGNLETSVGAGSASAANLAVGGSLGVASAEVEINFGDLVVSALGDLLEAAQQFVGTLNYVNGIVPEEQR
jgi:RHS repeat-associated protein